MRSCVVLNYIDWAHLGLPEHRDDWKIYTNLALIKYSYFTLLITKCAIMYHTYKRAILYTTLGSNDLDYLCLYRVTTIFIKLISLFLFGGFRWPGFLVLKP